MKVLAAGSVLLLLGWLAFNMQRVVITVRFMPAHEATLDSVFVTLGAEAQDADLLRRGAAVDFTFLRPDAEYPLVLGFWIGAQNDGWTGPRLHPRQRLTVTIGPKNRITWTSCDWPCW